MVTAGLQRGQEQGRGQGQGLGRSRSRDTVERSIGGSLNVGAHGPGASSDLSQVMRRMAENARAGDTTDKAEDIALAAERERTLYQAVRDFRLAARSTLGKAE
ncbi:hypothetical protein ABZ154_10470 [Streptomyces sp. NPDC006261]|uniref:hypothetical protein n=1 Tax=Streptomyces sp. NPDC006261 TaxID=3156739 RepID=UPI0033A7F87C